MSIHWGDITAKGCRGTQQEYTAVCWDAGDPGSKLRDASGNAVSAGNWEHNCSHLPAEYSDSKPSRLTGIPTEPAYWAGSQIWGRWMLQDRECGYVEGGKEQNVTLQGERWGPIEKGECVNDKRVYKSRCWDAVSQESCAKLDASKSEDNPYGVVKGPPTRVKMFANEIWGEWDVSDAQCDPSNTSIGGSLGVRTKTNECNGGTSYASNKDKYCGYSGRFLGGCELHPDAKQPVEIWAGGPIDEKIKFTLKAPGYLNPGEGVQTFLYQSKGGLGEFALNTDDSMIVQKNVNLPKEYHFVFGRFGTECTPSDMRDVHYGDKVQLVSAESQTIVKCGGVGRHCDADRQVKDASCKDTEWETFIIRPKDNTKKGNVCFGDEIRLEYLADTGTKLYLAAGDGGYTLLADVRNKNTVLELLPKSGSIYADPTKELDFLNENRDSEICKNSAWDPNCSENNWWIVGVIGGGIVVIVLGVMLTVLFSKIPSGRKTGAAMSMLQPLQAINQKQ